MGNRGETRPGREARSGDQAAPDDGEDLSLLARVNEGDTEALRALYLKYYHRLLRFIQRITGQVDAAQEVINDVMLVVWRDGRAFAGRSQVATWILGIAYRKALKMAERSRRTAERTANVDFDEWAERFPAAEELSQSVETEDLLERGLGLLSAEQRAVMELTYYFGCSYEEIGAITDTPVNTVKTRMFYAREKLRKLLPELGRDDVQR
ncbi:MAG TPA: sigma-70 family RNA polymerase sigma factor [Gammaproteobacteria bacterium]|nr:sigma-70 family RNA polymerase sigma factor [Gammaproteobacteria bacterium]